MPFRSDLSLEDWGVASLLLRNKVDKHLRAHTKSVDFFTAISATIQTLRVKAVPALFYSLRLQSRSLCQGKKGQAAKCQDTRFQHHAERAVSGSLTINRCQASYTTLLSMIKSHFYPLARKQTQSRSCEMRSCRS